MRAGKTTMSSRSLSAKALKAAVIRHKAEREAAAVEKTAPVNVKIPTVTSKKYIDLPAWARKQIKAEGEKIVLLPTNPAEQQGGTNAFSGIQAFTNFSATALNNNPDVLKAAVFFERPYVRKAMQHAKQVFIVFREASNPFWVFESINEAPAKGDIVSRIKAVSKGEKPANLTTIEGLDDGEAYVITTTRELSRAVKDIIVKHGGNVDFKDVAAGTTISNNDVVQATAVLTDAMVDEVASLNCEAKPASLCLQPDFLTETASVMASFLYRTAKKFDPKTKISQLQAVQSVLGLAACLHRFGIYARVQGYQLFAMATSQEQAHILKEWLIEKEQLLYSPVPFVRDAWGTRALAPVVHNEANTREEQAFIATAEKTKKETDVLILIEVVDKPIDTKKNFEKIASHLRASIVSNRNDQCVLAVVPADHEIVKTLRVAFSRRVGGPVAFEASVFHRDEDGDLDADAPASAPSAAAAAAPTATV